MNRKILVSSSLFFFIGLLLIFQFRMLRIGGKHIQIADIQNLKNEMEKERAELNQKKELIFEYEEILANLSIEGRNENFQDVLREQREDLILFSGLTDVHGEGIIAIITDSERDLLQNENPNNLIVHDVDIRNIVDDLRIEGAEAISINGQRIIFNHTKIFCNGPTIKINDEVFAQPFIIKAIGNRHHLESAINAPGKYGNILREWGIFVEVNTSVNVEILKYNGDKNTEYITIDKESE